MKVVHVHVAEPTISRHRLWRNGTEPIDAASSQGASWLK